MRIQTAAAVATMTPAQISIDQWKAPLNDDIAWPRASGRSWRPGLRPLVR